MVSRIRRLLLLLLCTAALAAVCLVGASAYETYTYPSMPSNWQNLQVTVGDVTMPFARYPSGSIYDPNKRYMTVEEQKEYGFNIGGNLDLRGWECVGFARYAYAALFYRPSKWPQNSSIDTSLAYSYSGSYAYIDMIEKVLGTRTLSSGYSADTLKKLFTACRPGAVMRCGGHSMVLMAIFNDGVLVYDANFSSDNEVNVRAYTWQSFVDRLGGRGIQALQMPSYYPGYSYSTGDNTYYQMDTSVKGTYVVYDCSSLNVRSAPSTSASRVGGLNVGEEVEVLGAYDGWYQIVYQGSARWAYADYLRAKEQEVEVTFNANGGKASFTGRTYTAGQTFGTFPTVSKTGRVFLGWYSGNTRYTASSKVPTSVSKLTLTAKWGVLTYTDVPEESWYATYVETSSSRGIISKASLFYPVDMATRAQAITVLGREFEWETGKSLPNAQKSGFQDVPDDAYYAQYVDWARQAGIANGTSNITFEPGLNITREQMVVFLYRLAAYTGRASYTAADYSVLYQFGDWRNISGYAAASVSWAVKVGLLKGDDLGNINPKNTATRAEMITMICRYTDFTKRSSGKTVQAPEVSADETETPEASPEAEQPETETPAEQTAPEEITETAPEETNQAAPVSPEDPEPKEEAESPAPDTPEPEAADSGQQPQEDPALIPDENGVVG